VDEGLKAILTAVIVGLVTIILVDRLVFFCISCPSTHEWLHHIGACLSGIPNIQLPLETRFYVPIYVHPLGIIAYSGQPIYTTVELTFIPLADLSLAVNFPYITARLVLLVPILIDSILMIIAWKRDSGFWFSVLCGVLAGLVMFAILTVPDINTASNIEWLNDALHFFL